MVISVYQVVVPISSCRYAAARGDRMGKDVIEDGVQPRIVCFILVRSREAGHCRVFSGCSDKRAQEGRNTHGREQWWGSSQFIERI